MNDDAFRYTLVDGLYYILEERWSFNERFRTEVTMPIADPTAREVLESLIQNYADVPFMGELTLRYHEARLIYLVDFSQDRVLLDKDRRMSEYGIAPGNSFALGSKAV